jgi:hypothetical protein
MLKFLILGFLATFIIWMLFATLMAMRDREELGRLPKILYILGKYVILPVGAIVDILYNWTFACVLFLDLPHELMLTARLERYLHDLKYWGTWRSRLALWFCKYMIEPHDPGHCHLS